MELIFIFILPLLFVLCNVSIENTFVYDNEGNYQTSERSISYTPIAYTITTETTYSLTHYTEWNFTSYTGDIYMKVSDFITDQTFGGGSFVAYNGSEKDAIIVWYEEYSNNVHFVNDGEGIDESYTPTIYNYNGDNYYLVSVSNFTFDVDDSEWEFNNGYYLMTSSTQDKYSPIVQLKNILADVIQIDCTNATYNVVFDYTCLWFIMFILWHLVYMFVDFLLHFWRKEEK